jgi:hypothetical protein
MNSLVSTLTRGPESQGQADPLREVIEVPGPRRAGPSTPRRRSIGRRLASEGGAVYILAFGLYLTIAVLLDLKYRTFDGDAFSRMANGFYVLYSRDPHLAAVGFVWEPLQSIADMVFLLGNHLWPALSHNDMAGSLVSALAMAGAVHQIRCALREWGVSRAPRLLLTAFFALDPMILLYSGNGMSEGLYLFTLVTSTRYLLRWMQRGDLRSLAYAAVALGFGYLTRNEAALAAFLGGLAVGAVSYGRARGNRATRLRTGAADLVIFGVPAFTAAAGWAITSYLITGQPFAQFTSIYGTSSQLTQIDFKSTLHSRLLLEMHDIGALAPTVPLVLVAAVVVALRRRDPRVLAPLAVLGGALGFDLLGYLHNSIAPWFRYFIGVVPLEILLVGCVVAAVQNPRFPRAEEAVSVQPQRSRGLRIVGSLVAVGIALVVLIPIIPTTVSGMLNPHIGIEENQDFGWIFVSHPTASQVDYEGRYPQILALSNYFDNLHLPDGNVVVDNSVECIPETITTSSQPKLFVIPNDQDFQRILADPITFHVHYIWEPNPAQVPVTATNILYPGLWKTGAGFAKMVHQFPARGTCPEFRLFRVLRHTNPVT